MRLSTAFLAVILLLAAAPLHAEDAVPGSAAEVQLSFAPIVKRTAPAVVNVYAQRITVSQGNGLFEDPFFRRFFGDDGSFGRPRERVQNSLGFTFLHQSKERIQDPEQQQDQDQQEQHSEKLKQPLTEAEEDEVRLLRLYIFLN